MDIIEASECLKNWFSKPISREDVDKSLILHDKHTTEEVIDEKVTFIGIDIVLEEIRVVRREAKVFLSNEYTEISSGEDNGCDEIQVINGEVVIIDD